MEKPSRGALEAVYGFVLRELWPKLAAEGVEDKKKPPVSASSKERRSSDEND